MYRPGTTAVLEDQAGFEAESEQAAAITRAGPAAQRDVPVPMAVASQGRMPPCTDEPDLFFAESPEDVECAKDLCRGCSARLACLAGAIERREPWGVWGGELFLRGEIVPRKRPRGRPRKHEVAA